MKIVSLIFLSPPRERIEVRGNDPHTSLHPHPDPLPSREREIRVMVFLGGYRGIFLCEDCMDLRPGGMV
jgi:hypothetical protein